MAGYPKELEREIVLRDGARFRLRPIRPEDQDRLIELYGRLGSHTAYQRFFAVMKRLTPDWARLLANVDYQRRLALIAERGPSKAAELVAGARYEPTERCPRKWRRVPTWSSGYVRVLGTSLNAPHQGKGWTLRMIVWMLSRVGYAAITLTKKP